MVIHFQLIFRNIQKHALESLLIILTMSIGIAVLTTVLVSFLGLYQQLNQYLQDDHYRLFSVSAQNSQNTISLRSAPPIVPEGVWEEPSLELSIRDFEEIQDNLPQGMFAFYTESGSFNIQVPRELELNVIGASKGFNEFNQLPLLAGEWFLDEDAKQGNSVLILGEELVNDLFGTENVLGQTISFEIRGASHTYTIIGILKKDAGQQRTAYVPLNSLLFPNANFHSFFVGIEPHLNPREALEKIQATIHLHLGEGAYVQSNFLQLQEELDIIGPVWAFTTSTRKHLVLPLASGAVCFSFGERCHAFAQSLSGSESKSNLAY